MQVILSPLKDIHEHYRMDVIKSMFQNRMAKISRNKFTDDTEFILSNPAYAKELLRRIEYVENGGKMISITLDELKLLIDKPELFEEYSKCFGTGS